MAKKYLQIQIPTPCSEDFSKMTPVEKGHFCNNCEKTVIDFSKMSDQEIVNFYKKNGGKLCGRFHHSQLNRDIRLTPPKVNSIFGKAAGLILTGVLSAGATNVAAESLKFEAPTEIIQVECEVQEKKEKDNDQFTTVKFMLVGPEYYQPLGVIKPLNGIQVIHLGTSITASSDSLGFAELKIPTTFLENDDLSFSIGNNDYHYHNKRICISKNDFKESNILKITLESEIKYIFVGNFSVTLSSVPQSGTFENLGPVNDFNSHDEIEIIEELKTDKSDFIKTSTILPPLGVAIKSIFPNPFIDKINLEISVEKAGAIQINLVDIAGRVVFQKEAQAERGTQQFQIEVGNLSLSGNMYILQVQDESGNMQSQQLMRYTNHGFTMR